eukprot:357135-Chlamydomonas_euryale.AAC.2
MARDPPEGCQLTAQPLQHLPPPFGALRLEALLRCSAGPSGGLPAGSPTPPPSHLAAHRNVRPAITRPFSGARCDLCSGRVGDAGEGLPGKPTTSRRARGWKGRRTPAGRDRPIGRSANGREVRTRHRHQRRADADADDKKHTLRPLRPISSDPNRTISSIPDDRATASRRLASRSTAAAPLARTLPQLPAYPSCLCTTRGATAPTRRGASHCAATSTPTPTSPRPSTRTPERLAPTVDAARTAPTRGGYRARRGSRACSVPCSVHTARSKSRAVHAGRSSLGERERGCPFRSL